MNIQKLNEATTIFLKYSTPDVDTTVCAEHDELFIGCVHPDKMQEADVKRLDVLGFRYSKSFESWTAFT
jgi:hypothetical protein